MKIKSIFSGNRSEPTTKQQTYNLGMIFRDEKGQGLTHPFFAELLNSFKNEAESRGYDVTFINHAIRGENMSYLDHCRFRKVDGVCLACLDFNTDEVRELVESEIPCVTVDHRFKQVAAVSSDNENGVHMLVDYAVSMGHSRIAFIHGHNNSVVTSTRIEQFRSAMEFHGLEIPDGYLCGGLYNDVEYTRDICSRLLHLANRPTCILLPDDYCYLGALEAAHEMGLKIPDDVSFAGYDGIGRECARKLITRIEQPESVSDRVKVYPVNLIKGGTVGRL